MGRLDPDDLLLKSIAFSQNFLSSPAAKGPPLYLIHKRDYGRRDIPCRPVLKFIALMGALILSKPLVLMVVETISLPCHSSYLFLRVSGVSSTLTQDRLLNNRFDHRRITE